MMALATNRGGLVIHVAAAFTFCAAVLGIVLLARQYICSAPIRGSAARRVHG